MKRIASAPRVILGSGAGPLGHASPPVRLGCGVIVVLASLLAPSYLAAGTVFLVCLGGTMVLVTRAPLQLVARVCCLGIFLYLPLVLVLLTPTIFAGGGLPASVIADTEITPEMALPASAGPGQTAAAGLIPALVTAAAIALKGTIVLLAALTTLSTLRRSELHSAVAGLPVPRTVRLILLQILHQTWLLFDETVRIRRALAIRAPAGGGVASIRIATALPRVWLERVAARAERTALALEIRGYHQHGASPLPPPTAGGWTDRLALAAAITALIGSLALQLAV